MYVHNIQILSNRERKGERGGGKKSRLFHLTFVSKSNVRRCRLITFYCLVLLIVLLVAYDRIFFIISSPSSIAQKEKYTTNYYAIYWTRLACWWWTMDTNGNRFLGTTATIVLIQFSKFVSWHWISITCPCTLVSQYQFKSIGCVQCSWNRSIGEQYSTF